MFENIFVQAKNLAKNIVKVIKRTGRKFGKKATGKTLRSLTQETFINFSGQLEINIYGSKAFEYIEKGRFPFGVTKLDSNGKPLAKLPPKGALLEWMDARGIPLVKEYAVRLGIARKGIKPTPLLEQSLNIINTQFIAELSVDFQREISRQIVQATRNGFDFGNIKI